MRLNRAIDAWIGELARKGKSPHTIEDYQRDLFNFADRVDPHGDREIGELDYDDCTRYLNQYIGKANSTMASKVSILKGLFRYAGKRGWLTVNPMDEIERPPRQKHVKRTRVKRHQVLQLIYACQNFQELLCVGAAIYMGRRRAALANARRSDCDLDEGVITFTDKGGKVINQRVPDEFLEVLKAAEAERVWDGPNDWLIPPRRKATTGTRRRESKVVYETVKKVAARAGVETHVHALRAAFAVEYLRSHDGQIEALKELMGHERLETTQVYLDEMNRDELIESVRDLSWGGPFVFSPRSEKTPVLQAKAHTGFEPVPGESTDDSTERAPRSPVGQKLDELRAQQAQPEKRKHRRTRP